MSGLNEVGYASVAVCIFFMALSVIAFCLRLWTRRLKGTKIGIDDWLVFLSVILFFAFCADVLVGVYTLGSGQTYTDPVELSTKSQQYLKSEYALPPLYAVDVTAIKLSILFMYRRLFPIPTFQKVSNAVIGICLIWFVVAIIGDMLYCVPMEKFWKPEVEGKCFNFALYFLVMELVDMLLDIAILCLPMKTVLGLHLSLEKRIGILGILLLGALVIVTSAVRIVYVYRPGDALLSLGQASLWSVINLGVAILCACLPTFRPLFPKRNSGDSSFWSRYFTRSTRTSDSTKASKSYAKTSDSASKPSSFYHRMDDGHIDSIWLAEASAKKQSRKEVPMLPLSSIRVQRDVDVV